MARSWYGGREVEIGLIGRNEGEREQCDELKMNISRDLLRVGSRRLELLVN